MTQLSVNINKIALIRNARGGNLPDLLEAAQKAEQFGAQGITVHPRPDARHITFDDVRNLKKCVKTELNVEGYPTEEFMELVLSVKPHQVTLVPDAPDALTSNAGWDTNKHETFLTEIVGRLKSAGIRSSVFMGTDVSLYEAAARTGSDRIELYTEAYAQGYELNPEKAIDPYRNAAHEAHKLGLGLNAGHDLNSRNLRYFAQNIPHLLEVSIGHALISEALYLGLEKTIQLYLAQINDSL
ncbi:MAG: pyridoxine 5'-phosphate synthase [Bacteroidia bacterium]|jgi:pyridoxine 5-phosphate synthase